MSAVAITFPAYNGQRAYPDGAFGADVVGTYGMSLELDKK